MRSSGVGPFSFKMRTTDKLVAQPTATIGTFEQVCCAQAIASMCL